MASRRFAIFILALATSVPLDAVASDWPDRPIHFIVPFPAGGSTDVAARVVGNYLSQTLGKQIVVENKSGANGNIGIEYVAKKRAGRLHRFGRHRRGQQQPSCLQTELRSVAGLVAGGRAFPSTHRAGGTSFTRREYARRTDGEGQAKAGLALRDRQRRRFAASHGRALVCENCRDHADTSAVSRRRPGDHRLDRWHRPAWLARHDAADPLLQGRHAQAARAIDGRALADPAGRADLSGVRDERARGRPVARRVRAGGTPPEMSPGSTAEINAAMADPTVRKSFTDQAQEPAGGTIEQYTMLVHDDYDKYARLVKELNIAVQ